ncbi:bifunctional 4-hydroxy-2-oxoglutarate aldolase/2-dehydro-3-deoxy-phosphogluconate aldolase [Marinimicrobium sp. C2-29]|uniref:bifunctional 4-hydroxy-2-oxoglutarate aldolase/2-dehydro-3-deoxy-phosphogluconate aldolase n=1 Tax=Marinimicrobium sp. C2-29 TaxID=3139825 RepID=UPI003139CAAF
MREQIVKRLIAEKLVVIIRVKDPNEIDNIVQCIADGGGGAVEITSNTPLYTSAIARIKRQFPQLLVGAGTITDPALAQEAIDAGAEFLVTPNTSESVVRTAHAACIPVVMGAMTPTEVHAAQTARADIVKLFPAGNLGPEYLAALARGPFLHTPFFPVGGIDETNAHEWMQNGAIGVGVGGSLACPVHTELEKTELTGRIRQLITALHSDNSQ